MLFDTLLSTFSVREMASVVSHELGHHFHAHIYLNIVNALLQLLLFLFLLSKVIFLPSVSEAVGVHRHGRGISDSSESSNSDIHAVLHISLYVAAELLGPLSVLTFLLSNACSRLFEYQADEFSVRHYTPSKIEPRKKGETGNDGETAKVKIVSREEADALFREKEAEKRKKAKEGNSNDNEQNDQEGKKMNAKEAMAARISKLMEELEERGEVEGSDKPGVALHRGLSLLSASHLDNLTPHPLFVFFHYTHPPVLKRLQAIDEIVKKL